MFARLIRNNRLHFSLMKYSGFKIKEYLADGGVAGLLKLTPKEERKYDARRTVLDCQIWKWSKGQQLTVAKIEEDGPIQCHDEKIKPIVEHLNHILQSKQDVSLASDHTFSTLKKTLYEWEAASYFNYEEKVSKPTKYLNYFNYFQTAQQIAIQVLKIMREESQHFIGHDLISAPHFVNSRQLSTGYYLEYETGSGRPFLHTPFGELTISSYSSNMFNDATASERIIESLGLRVVRPAYISKNVYYGDAHYAPIYEITKINNLDIKNPFGSTHQPVEQLTQLNTSNMREIWNTVKPSIRNSLH